MYNLILCCSIRGWNARLDQYLSIAEKILAFSQETGFLSVRAGTMRDHTELIYHLNGNF